MKISIPRLVIAGTHSGVGKTTLALGLMGSLNRRGFKVQPFKVGPDYIDPTYHTSVTGRPSRSLDTWLVPERRVLALFERAVQGVDIAIIEGVMGLYDGLGGTDEAGSTAQMAKLLDAPVLLVVDAYGQARSAGATVAGFKTFDRGVEVAGVLLNRVAGENHAQLCREAIEAVVGIPVLGAIPAEEGVTLPERHLGLIPTPELRTKIGTRLKEIVDLVETHSDLDRIWELAEGAGVLRRDSDLVFPEAEASKGFRVGVARDESFSFYYQDNLDLLAAYGCDLAFFSPLHDKALPENIDGLYLGGGFPQIYPEGLESNLSVRESIKRGAEEGMPIYAECGGLMYLTKEVTDLGGSGHRMVGLLDARTVMGRGLTLNYTDLDVVLDNPLSRAGDTLRGHEFHHSKIEDIPRDAKFAYRMKRGRGVDGSRDGWLEYNTLASYTHLHLAYGPKLVEGFVEACRRYQRT